MSTDTNTPSTADTITREATFAEKVGGSVVLISVGVWALAGIAAIIMSIVCFGFSGTTMEKAIGLAIAFFLGPLYFIFYAVNKSYCRSMGANVTRMMGGAVKAVESVAAN